jgi:hypothetical protein
MSARGCVDVGMTPSHVRDMARAAQEWDERQQASRRRLAALHAATVAAASAWQPWYCRVAARDSSLMPGLPADMPLAVAALIARATGSGTSLWKRW